MKNITIRSLRAKQESDSETADDFFKKPKNEIENISEEKHSRSIFGRLINFIILFIFVLTVGGVGGILTDRFAIPYLLANYPQLNQYEFLKQVNERTTIIETTKEVKISEDEAVTETIKSALPSIVQIVEPEKNSDGKLNGKFARRGIGVILTSDGVIVTSIESVNIASNKNEEKTKKEIEIAGKNNSNAEKNLARVELNNGKIYSAELIAENIPTGFAIIKIDKTNLPVLASAAFDNIKLGEKVVVLDDSVAVDIISKFIDNNEMMENGAEEGIKKRIKIMNSLDKSFNGAPVINLKREIVGISQGGDLFIPIDEIMALMNRAMSK